MEPIRNKIFLLIFLIFLLFPSVVRAEKKEYFFQKGSLIGFNAKSTLHPFTGKTENLTGSFEADLENLFSCGKGNIAVEAATLDTQHKGRDQKMRQHLAVKQHPLISFELKKCLPDTKQGVLQSFFLEGTLQLHGVSRPIGFPATLDASNPDKLLIKGETVLNLTDYKIKVPSVFGLIRMDENVVIWFELIATQ